MKDFELIKMDFAPGR